MEPLTEMPHHYSPPSVIHQSPLYTSPSPCTRSPQMERGPHGERCPYPETFVPYLPWSPVKELPPEAPSTEPLQRETLHPQSPLHPSLKAPVDEPSSRFPKRGPYGKRCPSPEPFLHIHQGPPAREPSLQIPFTELPQKETFLFSRFLNSTFSCFMYIKNLSLDKLVLLHNQH